MTLPRRWLLFWGSNHPPARSAGFWARLSSSPVTEEQLRDRRLLAVLRSPQRRDALAVPRIDVRARLQQRFRDFDIPAPRGHVQRRALHDTVRRVDDRART